jgi:hypothetical protein
MIVHVHFSRDRSELHGAGIIGYAIKRICHMAWVQNPQRSSAFHPGLVGLTCQS